MKSLFECIKKLELADEIALAKAVVYQEESNVGPVKALLETKALTEEELLAVYHEMYGFDFIRNIKGVKINEFALRFNGKKLLELGMIPQLVNGIVRIITSNPAGALVMEDYISESTGYDGNFDYLLVSESNMRKLITKTFGTEGQTDFVLEEITQEESGYQKHIFDVSADDISGIVTLINRILRQATDNGISDIHIEPQDDCCKVRFREDGILKEILQIPRAVTHQVISRIKTMAQLDVTNSRIVQDGNVRLDVFGKLIDLRVSVLPSACGENIVIRLLDKSKMNFDISLLGFSEENEEKFRHLISRPDGIMLLTGPTGSGKSTSLYAALSVLNTPERCIVTLEEPIEYRLPGLVQVPVNAAVGLTFPIGLRSALRQDLDILLIGEIRDPATAEIAVSASNSGHKVFSTLHTNSAASSIVRLVNMGIEPFLIASTLTSVINQRLVRRICPECKEEHELDENSPFRKVLGRKSKVTLYRGKGCEICGGTGYRGRLAVQEFLIVDDNIRETLYNGGNTLEIERMAIEGGMTKIQQDGIAKVLQGQTTLEEIHRVVFFEDL